MLFFQLRDPQAIIIYAIVICLAFAYHEFAHAIVADRLGDPTPRRHGRITLNPIPHLSLMGLVTLFLFGFGGAFTPVNPAYLRGNKRQSYALVALAGPVANLIMAMLFALPLHFVARGLLPETLPDVVSEFVRMGVTLNLFLMVFNLLPIPPLDGFSILQGVLPTELAYKLEPLKQQGLIILIVVVMLLPRLGIDIFGRFLFPTIHAIAQLILP